MLPISTIPLRPSRQVTQYEVPPARGQLPTHGAQDVQAGVVGGLPVLQIEEDVVVTAPVQGFHGASEKVGALHRQVAADSDRSLRVSTTSVMAVASSRGAGVAVTSSSG